MSRFLEDDDIAKLTGAKQKSKQVAALKMMRIPFFVTPDGKAVVSVSTIEGKAYVAPPKPKWTPPKG